MILESYPWKQDLLRRIALIKKYNSTEFFQKNEERAYTVLEKSIFYSAFIVRKLLDCKSKLSDEADRYSFAIQKLKPIKEINFLNSHRIDKNYDWKNMGNDTLLGRTLCNYLIHSYVFNFTYEEDSYLITGFMVSSDLIRNKLLYIVSLDDWLKYLYFIANDDIVAGSFVYNANKHDFDFVKKYSLAMIDKGHSLDDEKYDICNLVKNDEQ